MYGTALTVTNEGAGGTGLLETPLRTETETDAVVAVGVVADETDDVLFAVGGGAAADQVSCECKPYRQILGASFEDPYGDGSASENVSVCVECVDGEKMDAV